MQETVGHKTVSDDLLNEVEDARLNRNSLYDIVTPDDIPVSVID